MPRLSRAVVARPRLLDDPQVASDWALLVVQAGAGTGKTTFLTQLASSARFEQTLTAWMAPDPQQRLAAFSSDLCAALTTAGVPLRSVPAGEIDTRGNGNWLVREVASAVRRHAEPVLLVVDEPSPRGRSRGV